MSLRAGLTEAADDYASSLVDSARCALPVICIAVGFGGHCLDEVIGGPLKLPLWHMP